MGEFRQIPLTELVEPEHAARTTMDDAKLNSLVVSIREVGILEPLLVMPHEDGGFEIVAGHRRLKAARIAGFPGAPCIVVDDPASADAVKIHENIEREDLAPSDEAIFYAELYERNGEDTERVALVVKRSRDHVEGRLNLLRGDKAVFQALSEGKIAIGVAQEFNRFESEDDRLFHLDYAVRSGATVSQVRQWRTDCNTRLQWRAADAAPADGTTPLSPEQEASRSLEAHAFAGAAPHELSSSREKRPCVLCQEEHEEWRMLKRHVCLACDANVWPRILKLFSDLVV